MNTASSSEKPRGDTARRAVERALRIVALAMLAALLWQAWPRGAGTPRSVTTAVVLGSRAPVASQRDSSDIGTAQLLRAALRGGASAAVHATVRAIPPGGTRGAVAALAHAGVTVTWSDSSDARGLAVGVAALADPGSHVLLTVAAPSASSSSPAAALVMRDAAGTIDSVASASANLSLQLRNLAAEVEAESRGTVARASAPAALGPRRVRVYARPGWESKFLVAALEESGWSVDASLPVTARAAVTVGVPTALDTARYSAAVIVDSGVASATSIARFALQGGGVVLAGDALRDRALASLSPATVRGARPGVPGGLLTDAPTGGLEALQLAALPGASVLHREAGGSPTVVVRRAGSGRVLATAYRESWRWRMEGPASGADAHRAWWNGLVRAVAYAALAPADAFRASGIGSESGNDRAAIPDAFPGDAAPYADLVARLGAPSSPATSSEPLARTAVPGWLLLLLTVVLLLLEWGSRRLRGAR